MLSVILPRTDEPTVLQLTQENLQKELGSVPGAELLLADNWEDGIMRARNDFICLVEPDCLVSSGYFASNLGLFTKSDHFRKLAMVTSAVGLDNWANRIFGYKLESIEYGDPKVMSTSEMEIRPVKTKTQNSLFAIEIGFLPGAVIRKSVARYLLNEFKQLRTKNLVQLSTETSFRLWETGRRVHVNPNTTYVSTVPYLAEPPRFKWKLEPGTYSMFEKESI